MELKELCNSNFVSPQSTGTIFLKLLELCLNDATMHNLLMKEKKTFDTKKEHRCQKLEIL